MIIKLTVDNAEYIDIIEDFAKQFYERVYYPPVRPDDIPYYIWREEYLKPKSRVQKILNYNQASHPLHKDKEHLKAEVVSEWKRYVNEISEDRIDSKERIFLRDNLSVKIGFKFKEKDEGGKSLYYSTVQRKYLIQ